MMETEEKVNAVEEHFVHVTVQADGNVRVNATATILEQLGIAKLIEKNAYDMLDAARYQQMQERAETTDLARRLSLPGRN
jgi:isocitrate dehydrogenase